MQNASTWCHVQEQKHDLHYKSLVKVGKYSTKEEDIHLCSLWLHTQHNNIGGATMWKESFLDGSGMAFKREVTNPLNMKGGAKSRWLHLTSLPPLITRRNCVHFNLGHRD